ncbi:MAG: YtfJ family protein [Kiritimatiellota bacterium]|nr:YtfJ family protein [Kiritimatiellota bacterium]
MVGLGLLMAGMAFGLESGTRAPDFTVKSGDNHEIARAALKGKTVALLYETRDMIEQNRPLKKALVKLFDQNPMLKAACVVLPVINCSSARWPITKIWQNNLCEHSRLEARAIYGDWDGRMASDYGMQADSSNVVVIDRAGTIRFFRSGALTPAELEAVIALLTSTP